MALREDWYEIPVDDQESIDISNGTIKAKRKFRGPWDDRFQFLAGFIPTISPLNGSSFSYDLYTYPDIPSCVVQSAQITGKLVPNKLGTEEQISYDKAEITVDYQTDGRNIFLTGGATGGNPPSPDDVPVTSTAYSVKSVVELIKFDGKNVQRNDGVKQHDKGSYNYRLVTTEIDVTYFDTTSPDFTSAFDNVGCLNTATIGLEDMLFYLPFFSQSTLRYDGIVGNTKLHLRSIVAGTSPILVWEVTHKLVYNRLGWDRIPIGVEPQTVGQANATPINLVFDNTSLYENSPDNFAFLRRKLIG